MKIEYDRARPVGVTTLLSVSGGDLGDVLDDTSKRLRNAVLAAAVGYGVGRAFMSGDKPFWAALAAFGVFLVK